MKQQNYLKLAKSGGAMLCSLLLFTAGTLNVRAESLVAVSRAWINAPAPGQSVGAAYMRLQSKDDSTLVKVESPVAGTIEIHRTSMNNGVMQMRMLESLPLKAGKPVDLQPGGYHLMLFDLKKPLKVGDQVTLTLRFRDSAQKPGSMQLLMPVKSVADRD